MIDQFKGQYRFLSNFYFCFVEHRGLTFCSVENAYQAAKTDNLARAALFDSLAPGQAKRRGRKLALPPDWGSRKLAIMEELLRRKFHPGSTLAQRLLRTGDVPLVEGNTWGDTFWGVCDGVGENHLGRLLMRIRAELLENQEKRNSDKEAKSSS